MFTKFFLVALLALYSALATAQGAVYESRDKAGPVFSDQASSGAKLLDLPPIKANDVQQTPPPMQVPQPVVAPYSQLAIVFPADTGTIHTNTGAFDVQLQIQPAFDPAGGATIIVKLDGNPLAQGYASPAIHINEEDWARAATLNNIEHSLQVAIIDRTGKVLIESAPVRFYAHRAVDNAKWDDEQKAREAEQEGRREAAREAVRRGDHVAPHHVR